MNKTKVVLASLGMVLFATLSSHWRTRYNAHVEEYVIVIEKVINMEQDKPETYCVGYRCSNGEVRNLFVNRKVYDSVTVGKRINLVSIISPK